MSIKKNSILTLIVWSVLILTTSCGGQHKVEIKSKTPFVWEAANVYFLLTDRFYNADTTNDINFDRTKETVALRGFEGGDLKGITEKIKSGYFTELGINAIWMTPVMEQIHGDVNEGQGATYGFHGYWIRDWTTLDPNFGTKKELKELVETAHAYGIRIVLDAVVNHIGPVTDKDPVWESDWVRTGPACTYKDFKTTVSCTLVENLPDVKTESNKDVALPEALVSKWKSEGRYQNELEELDAFFLKTGYPRAPRFYIMKWLADYITEFGIDGYRVDTVKHTEAYVWKEFNDICTAAFVDWKKNNPEKVLDTNEFFTVAEVYNFNISTATAFDFGDKKVNYYENGFQSVINFEFKYNAHKSYEELFSSYSNILQTELKGFSVMNYFSSHDDSHPFDVKREKNKESATKLLLTPGISQVYYGDESDRPLEIEHVEGDANLRSFMNWDLIENDPKTRIKLEHWQKLGCFRRDHPAIGAGGHQMISGSPYYFSRKFSKGDFEDSVIVGLDIEKGVKKIKVSDVFENGSHLVDAYSNTEVIVKKGMVTLDSPFDIVLLALKK